MSMFLCTNDVNNTVNIPVKTVWIHDNYKKFSYYVNTRRRKCIDVNYTSLYYSECLSFRSSNGSHSRLNTKRYILFNMYLVHGKLLQYFRHHSPAYSWEESSQLCREAGGILPFFTSRDDLQELLTLLKFSEDIPPLEAIFIGLKGSFGNQVDSTFYHYFLILHKVI